MPAKWKELVLQLFFGIDTTNGIATCAILGLLFWVHGPLFVAFAYLLFAGFWAYAPDLDLLIYYPMRERWGLTDHWIIGHYPLFVIPGAGLITFFGATWLHLDHVAFLTTLAVVCVTGHFLHDSTEEIGLPWLAPFNWTHLSLKGGRPHLVERAIFKRYVAEQLAHVEGKELVDRLEEWGEPVTRTQVIAWTIAGLLFVFWATG